MVVVGLPSLIMLTLSLKKWFFFRLWRRSNMPVIGFCEQRIGPGRRNHFKCFFWTLGSLTIWLIVLKDKKLVHLTLICCKNCYVCLEWLKINEKRARGWPFKNNNKSTQNVNFDFYCVIRNAQKFCNYLKRRSCAWDSNPGLQDRRHRQNRGHSNSTFIH